MQILIENTFSIIQSFVGSTDFFNSLMVVPFVFGLIMAIFAIFRQILRSF